MCFYGHQKQSLPTKSIDPIRKDFYRGFVIGKLGEISSQIWL